MRKNNVRINEDYAYVSRVGSDFIFVEVREYSNFIIWRQLKNLSYSIHTSIKMCLFLEMKVWLSMMMFQMQKQSMEFLFMDQISRFLSNLSIFLWMLILVSRCGGYDRFIYLWLENLYFPLMLTKIGGLGILNTELTKFFSQFVNVIPCNFINRYQKVQNRNEVDTCSILTRLTGMWNL